jgi:hypothetical protein
MKIEKIGIIGLIRRKGGIKRGSCWVGNCRCVLMI